MSAGALHAAWRNIAVSKIYNQMDEYLVKTSADIDKIIREYESMFFLSKFNHGFSYSDKWANYNSAKAVQNMRLLGIKKFIPKKLSVFGILDKICDLDSDAMELIEKNSLEYRLRLDEKKKDLGIQDSESLQRFLDEYNIRKKGLSAKLKFFAGNGELIKIDAVKEILSERGK